MLKVFVVLLPMIAGAALAGTVRAATPLDVRADMTTRAIESSAKINLDGASLVHSDSSSLPEPASWAIMLTGFGVVGAIARRRRAGVAI